jgi:hypothetical protein
LFSHFCYNHPAYLEFQEWLGIRFTEKCDFTSAVAHFKRGIDLRAVQPTMKDALELWKTPVHEETFEDQERKRKIHANRNKHLLTEYNNTKELQQRELKQQQELERQRMIQRVQQMQSSTSSSNKPNSPPKRKSGKEGKQSFRVEKEEEEEADKKQQPPPQKDFSWFGGRHEDAYTIIYVPPPQGWHV